jgi:hypothetical protein
VGGPTTTVEVGDEEPDAPATVVPVDAPATVVPVDAPATVVEVVPAVVVVDVEAAPDAPATAVVDAPLGGGSLYPPPPPPALAGFPDADPALPLNAIPATAARPATVRSCQVFHDLRSLIFRSPRSGGASLPRC